MATAGHAFMLRAKSARVCPWQVAGARQRAGLLLPGHWNDDHPRSASSARHGRSWAGASLSRPRGSRSAAVDAWNRSPLGFQSQEYGLHWYPSKEALIQAGPGPVLVGTPYEYRQAPGAPTRQARKYSGFASHVDWWNCIEECNRHEKPQNLHEVLPAEGPRCLYFDLDGDPSYGPLHEQIVQGLSTFVRWFFSGDHLEWGSGQPQPVVMRSSDPTKYSCHVVFPQIQFANHAEQRSYLGILLNALPALEVQFDKGEPVHILQLLVDRVPYMPFQLFRGPYASKLSDGRFRRETRLEPETIFRGDPLACFAGHVDRHYALHLPPPARLLELNEEVRHFHEEQLNRVRKWPEGISDLDMNNLYVADFHQCGGGTIDLAGLADYEKYEVALQLLHPDRASQFWSWFRISGVTFSMLEKYSGNREATNRIWDAHFEWSRRYPYFDQTENVDQVMKCSGRKVSGLPLLMKLLEFDNPDAKVRHSAYRYNLRAPRKRTS